MWACFVMLVLPAVGHAQPASPWPHVAWHIANPADVDPARADAMIPWLRSIVARKAKEGVGPNSVAVARLDLLLAQAVGTTGTGALVASLDTLLRLGREERLEPNTRALAMLTVARGLAQRRGDGSLARMLAATARELSLESDAFDRSGLGFTLALGDVYRDSGAPDSAAIWYARALEGQAWSEPLGRYDAASRLGQVLEQLARPAEALAAFEQAAAVALRPDSLAESRVPELARTLGLDADSLSRVVASAREANRCPDLVEPHRTSGRIPNFHQRDARGVKRDRNELEGHFSVLVFRDLTCPFCRVVGDVLPGVGESGDDPAVLMVGLTPGIIEYEDAHHYHDGVDWRGGTFGPAILDADGSLSGVLEATTTPAFLILNPAGRVRFRLTQPGPLASRLVQELLHELRENEGRRAEGCR